MSSFVVYDALVVGLKEGLKLGIVWLVFRSYLVMRRREVLIRFFAAGVAAAVLSAAAVLIFAPEFLSKDYISNIIGSVFALLLIGSAVALLDSSGFNLLGPLRAFANIASLQAGAAFCAALLFFLPDFVGMAVNLREIAVLSERGARAYLSVSLGLVLVLGAFLAILRRLGPAAMGSFFDFPQLLLFLAMVKLLGGGVKGITELSLIPAVQRGLMKFSHDIIHQTFVILMVPDHPLLKTTVWNFIGFFFGPNIASGESLLLLILTPLIFVIYSLSQPIVVAEAVVSAGRRKIRHQILSDRRRKAVPVLCFLVLILVAWFSGGGETASRLYNPKPKPVVADKGIIMIPLKDPTMDLKNGALHKFVLNHEGRQIRFLVVRKTGNALAVCLDACEICPPDGYGQQDSHVVCIYCNTPIPVSTLGKAGGCNPIPLEASIDGNFMRIGLAEILKKWDYVNSGKGRETVK